jgi:hypothetical protein
MKRKSQAGSGKPERAASRCRGSFIVALLFAAALPRAAYAQLSIEEVPRLRLTYELDQIKSDMDRSLFHVGPVRVLPAVAITNAGYNTNVFGTSTNEVADWTATISAGARFTVPFGSKTYLRVDAFPRYIWYDKIVQRREFGGVYTGSLFGFFNHMNVQVSGNDIEDYKTYSSELDTRVLQRTHGGFGRLDLDLSHNVSFLAGGGAQWIKYEQIAGPPDQEINVHFNDRLETGAWSGFRYKFTPDFDVSGLVAGTWSDFDVTPVFRNNRSLAFLGNVRYQGPLFYLNLTGGYKKGFAVDSTFPDYATPIGGFFLSCLPIRWLEIQGYGHRTIPYSVSELNPYYFEDRIGGQILVSLGSRFQLRGYGEVGPNTYPRAQDVGEGVRVKRRDDATIYGGGLVITLSPNAELSGLVTRNVYTSNIVGEGRSYTQFFAALSFQKELTR